MQRVIRILFILLLGMNLFAAGTFVYAAEGQDDSSAQHPHRLIIDEAGTYTLDGSMEGTVYVDPGAGEVTLILNNARIQSGTEPAIMAVSGDRLTIDMGSCSCSRISDSAENTFGAAIYSETDVVISGSGCMQVNGNSRYGIVTQNADLTVNGGTSLIVSKSSGVKAGGDKPGMLTVNGGALYINAKSGDMVQAENIHVNGGILKETEATCVCQLCRCCRGSRSCGSCSRVSCRRENKACEDEDDECCCRPSTDIPGPIVEGQTGNSAQKLVANRENALFIGVSGDYSDIQITQSGAYYISGAASNGSITVSKGSKGVVLILGDLNLTSLSGAALHINSDAEVKIVIEGEVTFTDSSGASDAVTCSGAAVKAESGTTVNITGDGRLKIRGNAGNGIKMGENSSLVTDGDVEIEIKALGDGISSGNDVAINNKKMTIEAGGDGIHADHILTIGEDGGSGPELDVVKSTEGLEAEVINMKGGDVDITASEDGISLEECGREDASFNMTGGDLNVDAEGSAIDSDNNVNLIDGSAEIHSGEDSCCIDREGELYISDDFELSCDCECEEECPNE